MIFATLPHGEIEALMIASLVIIVGMMLVVANSAKNEYGHGRYAVLETAGIALIFVGLMALVIIRVLYDTKADTKKDAERLIENESSIEAIYPKNGNTSNSISVYYKDKKTGLITKKDISFDHVEYKKDAADITYKESTWTITVYIPLSYVRQDKKAEYESKAVTDGTVRVNSMTNYP